MAKNNFGKRILAVALACILAGNLLPLGAAATQNQTPAMVENFEDTYYKQDGTAGTAEDWQIHLSKTAEFTGEDNLFDITLTVETKDTETQIAGAAHGAAVLVLDVSSSMVKDAGGNCVRCGEAKSHSDHSGRRAKCAYEAPTHLDLLKEAVKNFLDTYVQDAAEGEKRLVAIVKFATDADTVLSWIDVNQGDNLATVKDAVDAMASTSGTNIEAGLVLGRNLLKLEQLKDIPLANQSLILFSDGSPTVAVGDVNDTSITHVDSNNRGIAFGGNSCEDDLDEILEAVTAKKKAVAYNTDAALLKRCFGAENVITSSADSLALDLAAEAGRIVTTKTNATNVTDPMGNGISLVTVTNAYNAATEQWDLSKVAPVIANGITTYTITYRVELDPMAVELDPNFPGYTVLTPANGVTTLNYTYGEDAEAVVADFNEPNVRGIRSFAVRYAYVGEVPENAPQVPADQVYKAGTSVQVAAAPVLANYTFSGWDRADFVMPAEDVVIYGSWTENPKYDYTLIYNANFGEEETKLDAENVTGIYAEEFWMVVDANAFVREGYNFVAWNTAADGTGASFAADDVIGLTSDNNTVVLYAQWEQIVPPTTEPTVPPTTEPVVPPTTEPVVPPTTEPVVPPTTEPVVPPTTEQPTVPPTTVPPTTEPPVTEPPATEPPVTEPPVTEPPVTEPPVTEPPVTQPPVTEPPVTEPPVTEPPVTEPPVTEPSLEDLEDPDVPLTENPKTGDPTILLAGLVVVSGSGMLWLKGKKKEEEE